MKRIKLLALALAGVMALALLTGCSDSKSKAEQVEEYFYHYYNALSGRYEVGTELCKKDEVLDTRLEAIAQAFRPEWVTENEGAYSLSQEAESVIQNQLRDYVGRQVTLYCTEVDAAKSAMTQATELGKRWCSIRIGGQGEGNAQPLFAFVTTPSRDGRRFYLAMTMQ